jgi:hypothetical protein
MKLSKAGLVLLFVVVGLSAAAAQGGKVGPGEAVGQGPARAVAAERAREAGPVQTWGRGRPVLARREARSIENDVGANAAFLEGARCPCISCC